MLTLEIPWQYLILERLREINPCDDHHCVMAGGMVGLLAQQTWGNFQPTDQQA